MIRVVERHVLRNADETIGIDGHSKRSLAGVSPSTNNPPNNKISFQRKRDALTIGGRQPGICRTGELKAHNLGSTFIVFTGITEQRQHHRQCACGEARQIGAGIGHTAKYGNARHIVAITVH